MERTWGFNRPLLYQCGPPFFVCLFRCRIFSLVWILGIHAFQNLDRSEIWGGGSTSRDRSSLRHIPPPEFWGSTTSDGISVHNITVFGSLILTPTTSRIRKKSLSSVQSVLSKLDSQIVRLSALAAWQNQNHCLRGSKCGFLASASKAKRASHASPGLGGTLLSAAPARSFRGSCALDLHIWESNLDPPRIENPGKGLT